MVLECVLAAVVCAVMTDGDFFCSRVISWPVWRGMKCVVNTG